MTTVTNNTANPIVLPFEGAAQILSGATVDVPNWKDVKDHPFVARLLDQKLLTTGGEPEPEVEQPARRGRRAAAADTQE